MKSAVLTSLLIAAVVLGTAAPRAQQASAQRPPVFRTGTELITVNVVVRDKNGNVVRNLTKDDFAVVEDDKPQQITSFDFEELDKADAEAAPAQAVLEVKTAAPKAAIAAPADAPAAPPKIDMHGRRLIVLFFDLSSMQPEELDRAVKSAHDYVDSKLAPSDLIAIASFATAFKVDSGFTSDKAALGEVIDRFNGASGQGFEEGGTGDAEGTADNGNAFTADDTEFNIFNTDRRLDALQTLSDQLSGIEQKKSVIYFSSGMNQSGTDNQVELRRTVDRATRANVSIYAADMRGLQAQVPGGDATQGSVRGRAAFSGASVSSQFDKMAATQDTLSTMAEDTGGRAFFDSNSFGDVFNRVVADTSAYYILGYSTTNPARDGRYRRIKVRLTKRTDLKLENRNGYYAPRDFAHSTKDDRQQQLQDQLMSDLSLTDLTAYVAPAYFRLSDNRFWVPLSVVIPGYEVPFTHATDKSKSTIDVLAVVRDAQNRPVGRVSDTMKLALDVNEDLKKKMVQYETGMELAPGKFHVKVVVRENQNGTMGSYETDIVVPDLKSDPVKLSSIVLGTSLQPGAGKNPLNPLVSNGRELVPNVTHVVSPGQHLYFYYEVYDPKNAPPVPGGAAKPGIRVMTSIAFFRGKVRAFETPLVETTELTSADRKSAIFQFDVPSASLPPGLYTCQVNVVDDVAGTFTFPRMQLFVRK
jgi:VWFA-related protein